MTLASVCTKLWDVQSFIFCARAGAILPPGMFWPRLPDLLLHHSESDDRTQNKNEDKHDSHSEEREKELVVDC